MDGDGQGDKAWPADESTGSSKKGKDIGEDQTNTFRAVPVNWMSSRTLKFNVRKVACSHRPI